ncbi:MAG: hypothetical protein QY331_11970 [Melioribacteraceae bacterium]|jgi:hypothetical protein|nr:hypothetical protein [Melioribacteraceae bacterium]RJP58990.1 MAG: hypothetical protein C4543_07265 [Ignavibacteriales bacterium]WKZ68667.1 MAG: hypothetical protein QY331_11970 [Melioribacteraceae bacterium]
MKKRYILLLSVLFLAVSIKSQNLDETLSNLSADAASAYVAPITSGFGSNLNSGWFAYPPAPVKFGFTARLRVVGTGTFFSSDDETFSSSGSFRYNSQQADAILANSGINPGSPGYQSAKSELLSKYWDVTFSGPTIIGSENEYFKVRFGGGTVGGQQVQPYEEVIEDVYGYLDGLTLLPSANIQLTLGTVMGTNLVLRWFPSLDIEDLGKFEFFGFGLIHNTNVWFQDKLPVDLSVGGYYQKLTVGDIFESNATQFGLYASKTFGGVFAVTPYLGLTTESSTTTVSYNYNYDTPVGPQDVKVEFDIDGKNSVGFTAGLSFKLAVVNLNIDYKAAKSGTITAGLSFGVL